MRVTLSEAFPPTSLCNCGEGVSRHTYENAQHFFHASLIYVIIRWLHLYLFFKLDQLRRESFPTTVHKLGSASLLYSAMSEQVHWCLCFSREANSFGYVVFVLLSQTLNILLCPASFVAQSWLREFSGEIKLIATIRTEIIGWSSHMATKNGR